jgi:hypothetical protein
MSLVKPWQNIDEVAQARSTGLEPVTQGLEIPCSIQLSYERFSTGSLTDVFLDITVMISPRQKPPSRNEYPRAIG